MDECMEIDNSDSTGLPCESLYTLRLIEWARQIPIIRLPIEWEQSILELIPWQMKHRHPQCVERSLNEIRDNYATEMENCAISASIIVTADSDRMISRKIDHPYDFCVARQRKFFANEYFFSHNIMRSIVELSEMKLPRVIVDFDAIITGEKCVKRFFELTDLHAAIMDNVSRSRNSIKNDYYREISKIIESTKGIGEIVGPREMLKALRLLQCAENLFVQQIVKVMIRTIDDLCDRLSDCGSRCPRLNLRLVWREKNDRLSIDPPIDSVYSLWKSVVDAVDLSVSELPKFSNLLPRKINDRSVDSRMKVRLPVWYVIDARRKIDHNLTNLTDPLEKHIAKISADFLSVTSAENRRTLMPATRPSGLDIRYCTNVKKLDDLKIRATEIVDSLENFEIGRIDQSEARIQLRKKICDMRSSIVRGMLLRHETNNEEICKDFQDLAERLLDVPNRAPELFLLCETIAPNSMSLLLDKFESRVARSIEILGSLLDVASAEVTEKHTILNRNTINWLEDIKPIVVKSNTLCEAMKSELEDELQRRIVKLNLEIEALLPKFEILDSMDDATRVDEYIEHLRHLVDAVGEVDAQIEAINHEEHLLKFPETTFPIIEEVREILLPVHKLNNLVREWRRDQSVWLFGPFEYIDAVQVREKSLIYYRETFEKLNSSLRNKIKADMQGGAKKIKLFSGMVDDPDPMQQPAPLTLCSRVLEEVRTFEGNLELIECLCNPSMRERHWKEISIIHGESAPSPGEQHSLVPDAGTTLAKLISLDLIKDIERYRAISIGANKELALANRLEEMIGKWDEIDFTITSSMTFVRLDDVKALMEEHELLIGEMKVSYFAKPIAEDIEEFCESLKAVGWIVDTWLRIRSDWQGLQLVFRKSATADDLAEARKIFSSINSTLLGEVERHLQEEPKFRCIVEKSTILRKLLADADENLEKVKHAVHLHVQQLRNLYSRFFFISDREVLEIRFEPNYTRKMKLLVKKCFTDIKNVKCRVTSDKNTRVDAIIDFCDRQLNLLDQHDSTASSSSPDVLVGSFIAMDTAISRTLRHAIAESFETISNLVEKEDAVGAAITLTNCPAGIVGVCSWRLFWTREMERALREDNLRGFSKIVEISSRMIGEMLVELRSGKQSRNRHDTLVFFITEVREQQDVTLTLMKRDLCELGDFEWNSQIRHYLRGNNIIVSILDTEENYGYEFSNCQPIVRTPLTERCYRSLVEARRNQIYGLVFGPGATGKSHTIRSLARTLFAIDLRIFHCSNLDYRSMENIFRGLDTEKPRWLLFKHLDLLASRELSVFDQSIVSCSTKHQGGFIIGTISSGGIGCNRSTLSDTVKSTFRPIAFAFPDTRRILEVVFFSQGFSEATKVAEKVRLFSKYTNLDIATLMTAVRVACTLKIANPHEAEEAIVLRALVDVYLPKVTADMDLKNFQYTIDDLFPNIALSPPNYQDLLAAIERIIGSTGQEKLTLKIIQFFEMILMQRAVILVGSTLSGKSTVINSLEQSLSLLNENRDNQSDKIIPPKVSITRIAHYTFLPHELFGEYEYRSQGSKKWKDGILTRAIRGFTNRYEKSFNWLILDGPLEANFLQTLSSLVDTKELLLTSGERIPLPDSASIIVETASTRRATPATITHCGLVYLDDDTIDWKLRIRRWVSEHQQDPNDLIPITESQEMNREYETFVQTLLKWSIGSCLDFVHQKVMNVIKVPINDNHAVTSVLQLFEIFLSDALGSRGGFFSGISTGERRDEERCKSYVNNFFSWSQGSLLMAIVWGLGGYMDRDRRADLSQFCKFMWRKSSEFPYDAIVLPSESLVQDNFYLAIGNGSWRTWSDVLKKDNNDTIEYFWSSVRAGPMTYVPNSDSIRYTNLFETHVKYGKPFIVSGDIGKTLYIRYILRNKKASNVLRTADCTAEFIGGMKKLKETRCINFIDDMSDISDSLCNNETILREFLRQHYDRNEGKCGKVLFLGAIDSSKKKESPGNREEAARFFRHFNLYRIDSPSDDSIYRIFSSLLSTNLRNNMFTTDVNGAVTSIVNATIHVYSTIVQRLKPVPQKFQYRFSLKDISRVIDGCSLMHKESADAKLTFMRLWVHETIRVFADRIIDREDAELLHNEIKEAATLHFKDPWETAFDNLPKNDSPRQLTYESFRHLVFCDFMRIPLDTSENNDLENVKRYEDITSREALKSRAILHLERYNTIHKDGTKKLDIIIFPVMLEHLMRICRILDIPGSSLLMLCFGAGTGRRSLAALAAHIKSQSFEELTPCLLKTGNASWKDDFKRASMNCIIEPGDRTFFISYQDIIVEPLILEDILYLMKTGRGSKLFSSEDRSIIIEKSRLGAQDGDRNAEMTSHEVMNYFYHNCQEKLHFLIYYDCSALKSGGSEISRKLLDHCTIDCYESWPEDALIGIGNKFMKEDAPKGATFASKYFYDSVRLIKDDRVLPVSAYIHLVKLYGISMKKRREETRVSRMRYQGGLEKLKMAEEEVKAMRTTLTRLRPELESSAEETAETMRQIERENVSVEMATIQVKTEEQVANGIAEIAGILKEECEADLAVAIPILEDAIAALNTLKPTDITLVKAMKNPPDTVKLVLAAVCVMLSVAPDRSVDPVTGKRSTDYWAPSKRILGDMNFLQNLKDYDKDNIPNSVMTVIVRTYMNDESFMPHIVAKASSAAEGLCKWVRAMVSYDEVAKIVAPKKEKLASAERDCNASLQYLNEMRTRLAALNEKLAVLNASLETTLRKKLQLEHQVAVCTGKLKRAEALIESLAGEKARWLNTVGNLARIWDNLAGDTLISCATVALLSPYSPDQRDLRVNEWKEELDRLSIPNSGQSYKLFDSVAAAESANFQDTNTLILQNCLLWPLILDPQSRANAWIKRVEAPNGLVTVRPTNPLWLEEIGRCVKNNLPILLENLDRSECVEKTTMILHSIANSSLRLYITSRIAMLKEANLQQCPAVYKQFCVVNFGLANEALEDRLLEIIVSRERPELRDTFDRAIMRNDANRRLLDQEEDKILVLLSGTNIIEDERAIEVLDRWKNLSTEIAREQASRATIREMNEFRAVYRPLTKYCASLYDTLSCLANLNHMYRFSLEWFIRLYVRSIDASMRSANRHRRMNYLASSFTRTLDFSVRNALRKEHKLLYSFILAVKILRSRKDITDDELRAFLMNRTSDNLAEEEIVTMLASDLPNIFENLTTSFQDNSALWKTFFSGKTSCTPWDDRLTDFQRLLLVSRLRPEKTIDEVSRLVDKTLKSTHNSISMAEKLSCAFEESSCLVPLIFVLPSYLEPYKVVEKWAKTIGYSSKIVRYSMPPESARKYLEIEEAIVLGRKIGTWILLENCHLATDEFLARLEDISVHETEQQALTFRLWLTSYSCLNFPTSILHDSAKIHCDKPSDEIADSLLEFYSTEPLDDSNFYDIRNNNGRTFAKIVYAMCFFHAIVAGRNVFYSRSWNLPAYEFTDADRNIAIRQLRRFAELDYDERSLDDHVRYVLGECYYGGRVLDPIDRNCLKVLLENCCKLARVPKNTVGDRDPAFSVPARSEYRDILRHINMHVPKGASPAWVFGLDENAAILKDCQNADIFLRSLTSATDPMAVPPTHYSADIRDKFAKKDEFELLDGSKVKEEYPILYEEPLNAIIVEEIQMYNRIIGIIRASLLDEDKRSSEEFLRLINDEISFVVGRTIRIPGLSRLLDSLPERRIFLDNWSKMGHYTGTFWVGGLIAPWNFFSALKLMFARKFGHVSGFNYDITKFLENDNFVAQDNSEEFYLHGFYLTGARWDIEQSTLVESWPKLHFHRMPIVRCVKRDSSIVGNCYSCPVISIPETVTEDFQFLGNLSSNYVTRIPLASKNVDRRLWNERGTLLYCNK